jgi:hypothetical protein
MINVAKFRAKIEEHIAAEKAAHAGRLKEWDAYLVRHKAEWIDEHGAGWLDTAKQITKKIKAGEVIRNDDVRSYNNVHNNRHSSSRTWSAPYQDDQGRGRPDSVYRIPTEVCQVLDALELIDEPEISHTALVRVGVNTKVMAAVSRYLTRRK